MATKVMLAPAIVRREAPTDAPPRADPHARPRRRRSSVYDADGNEVFITLLCLKCQHVLPLAQFGLRRMTDGAIRNQPWCKRCRNGATGAPPRRQRTREAAAPVDRAPAGDDSVANASVVRQPADPSALAAQVMAALHGGRR